MAIRPRPMPSSRLAFLCVLALAANCAAQGKALRGLVLDVVLRPIPAATVEARDAATDKLVASGKTDGSGLFVLGRLPRQPLMVRATAGGHGWLRKRVDYRDGVQRRGLVFLLPDAADLTGVVVGPGSKPVQDAWVVAASPGTERGRETKTDAEGWFKITKVPLGDVRVHVFAAGMKALKRTLFFRDNDRESHLALHLETGGRANIRVEVQGIRNASERERIGVQLRLYEGGRYRVLPRGLAELVFAKKEACWFRGLPPGTYTISAKSSSRAIEPRFPSVVLGTGDTAHQGFRVIHPSASPLRGTVTDSTGCPLPGVTVRASHPYWLQYDMLTATNSKGEFAVMLPFPPGEQYQLSIRDTRWVLAGGPIGGRVPRPDAPAGLPKIVLQASKASSIQGRVFDAKGRPLPWATVRMGRHTACTGADGSYILGRLPPTEQVILTVNDPRMTASRDCNSLRAGDDLRNIHLLPTAVADLADRLPVHEVVGIVTDLEARPLAGAEIKIGVLDAKAWEPLRTAHSNTRGEFRLTCIPAGEYLLWGQAGVGVSGTSERFHVTDVGKPAVVKFRINRR